MSNKYCAKCGTEYMDEALFCDMCGEKRPEKALEPCSQCDEMKSDKAIETCSQFDASIETESFADYYDEPIINQVSKDNSWAFIRQRLKIIEPAKKKTNSPNIILVIVLVALIVGVSVTLFLL